MSMNDLERMGNAESEIMKVLWQNNSRPATSAQIRKALEVKSVWSKSTVLTLIHRLVEKGFIACKKKKVFYYTPLVSEEEYLKFQTKSFIDRIYDGSVKNLLSALCSAEGLSKGDIEELQEFLDREANKDG
jgi:BlaI family penicillinase repressor